MSERPVGTDRRGLSEAVALAVLVGMVVVTTGALGIYVLVTDADQEQPAANFSFEYFSDTNSLLVTHAEGESVTAGDVLIEGPNNAVTWAEVANDAEDADVTVGDSVQLGQNNVYGTNVLIGDRFRVYESEGGNRTELSAWEING